MATSERSPLPGCPDSVREVRTVASHDQPTVLACKVHISTFEFLLLDGYSTLGFTAAIETLSAANRVIGSEIYRWRSVSLDGGPVEASNGTSFAVDKAFAEFRSADIMFVCADRVLDFHSKPTVLSVLRRWVRSGGAIGAMSTGAQLWAEAGQLDGVRCVIHWENRASFVELYPEVECTGSIFEIDRQCYTCAGGSTSIDLILEMILRDFGAGVARRVANLIQHDRVRSPSDQQRVGEQPDLSSKSSKLHHLMQLMIDNIEDPLSCDELAVSAQVSKRQVERLFERHTGMTPSRYYQRMRLERGRELLRQTNLPILDIAIATGFTSHSYFAQIYRSAFGRAPREERRPAY